MFVGVDLIPVPVFMRVYVGMLMRMQVFVFVCSFHDKPSFYNVYILYMDTFHGQPSQVFLADEVEPELLKRPTEISVMGGAASDPRKGSVLA